MAGAGVVTVRFCTAGGGPFAGATKSSVARTTTVSGLGDLANYVIRHINDAVAGR